MEQIYDMIVIGGGPAGMQAALAARYNSFSFIFTGHLCDDLAGLNVGDDGSFGYFDDQVLCVGTVASLLAALFSISCYIFPNMTKIC